MVCKTKRKRSEWTRVNGKENKSRDMAGSLGEAWRKKTTRKGYQKKKEGLKEEECRTRDGEIQDYTKGKNCIFYFIFFFFLLYWSVGKCTFLFSVGKPIKLAPDERVSLILVDWNFPYNTFTCFGRSIVSHCNIISWKHGLQRNGWWSAPSKKKNNL